MKLDFYPGIQLDSDFQAYMARGGGISAFTQTELEAGNKLVLDLKASGLWAKLIGFYPFLGRAAEPGRQNLISSSYALTLYYDWSFATWGARGDGFGSYAKTGFLPLIGWPEYASGIRHGSFGLDILQDQENGATLYRDIQTHGTGRVGASGADLFLTTVSPTVDFPGWNNGGSDPTALTIPGTYVGTWVCTYLSDPSSNEVALTHPDVTRTVYQGNTVITTAATQWYPPADGGGAYTLSGELAIGGGTAVTRGPSAQSSDRPMSCAFFGTGLTAADVTNLNAVIASFRSNRKGMLPSNLIIGNGDSIMQAYASVYSPITGGGSPGGALSFLISYTPWTELTPSNVKSYAVGGLTSAGVIAGYESGPHMDADVANKYILWVGTNDIASAVSQGTIIANIKTACIQAAQDGLTVIVLPILKRSDWAEGSANDSKRIAVNAASLAAVGTYVDQFIDVDSVISYDMTNATYFGDETAPYIHPNETGHKLIWSYVASQLR